MIAPSSNYRIYLATSPVDFRKGMDGLANYVLSNFDLDPLSGAFFDLQIEEARQDQDSNVGWDRIGSDLQTH